MTISHRNLTQFRTNQRRRVVLTLWHFASNSTSSSKILWKNEYVNNGIPKTLNWMEKNASILKRPFRKRCSYRNLKKKRHLINRYWILFDWIFFKFSVNFHQLTLLHMLVSVTIFFLIFVLFAKFLIFFQNKLIYSFICKFCMHRSESRINYGWIIHLHLETPFSTSIDKQVANKRRGYIPRPLYDVNATILFLISLLLFSLPIILIFLLGKS